METFSRSSTVDAPPADVWARVTTFAGINHELMPWMRMTPPRRHRGESIATVPTRTPLGVAVIWYLGFLPFDHDRMTLAEVVPGVSFHEISTMATMRHWEHHRVLEPVGGHATLVTDTIRFEPRLPGPITGWMVRRLFAHRHRRLRTHFAPPRQL